MTSAIGAEAWTTLLYENDVSETVPLTETVEVTRVGDQFTAIHPETGAEASGPSRADALRALAAQLDEGVVTDPREKLTQMAAETHARTDEDDVTEDAVEDAIEWARS